jgi:hypothetical protein
MTTHSPAIQKAIEEMKAKREKRDPIILAIVRSVRQDIGNCTGEYPVEDVQDAYFVDRAYEAAEDLIEDALSDAYRRGAEAMREKAAIRAENYFVSAHYASVLSNQIRHLHIEEYKP